MTATAEGSGARTDLGCPDGEDRHALARCVDGDPVGLEQLYQRHAGSCHALARRLLRNAADADDVVQEAFVSAWRDCRRYDGAQATPHSWLLMLTHRRAVDRIRRHRRRPVTALEHAGDPADPRRGPEQDAMAAMLEQPVRDALAGLSLVQREALVLAFWGGYTQREIADLTGAPLGTVKTRMHKAMLTLRQSLDGVAA